MLFENEQKSFKWNGIIGKFSLKTKEKLKLEQFFSVVKRPVPMNVFFQTIAINEEHFYVSCCKRLCLIDGEDEEAHFEIY